jgi:hypothetical protein
MYTLLSKTFPDNKDEQRKLLKSSDLKNWKIEATGFQKFVEQSNLKVLLETDNFTYTASKVNGYFRVII